MNLLHLGAFCTPYDIYNSFCFIGLRLRFLLLFSFRIIPNCVMKAKNVRTRIFIGDQIDECKDLSSLYYLLPFQKVITLVYHFMSSAV